MLTILDWNRLRFVLADLELGMVFGESYLFIIFHLLRSEV